MTDYRLSREQVISLIRYLRGAEVARADVPEITPPNPHTVFVLDRLLAEVEAKRIKTPQVPRLGS